MDNYTPDASRPLPDAVYTAAEEYGQVYDRYMHNEEPHPVIVEAQRLFGDAVIAFASRRADEERARIVDEINRRIRASSDPERFGTLVDLRNWIEGKDGQ